MLGQDKWKISMNGKNWRYHFYWACRTAFNWTDFFLFVSDLLVNAVKPPNLEITLISQSDIMANVMVQKMKVNLFSSQVIQRVFPWTVSTIIDTTAQTRLTTFCFAAVLRMLNMSTRWSRRFRSVMQVLFPLIFNCEKSFMWKWKKYVTSKSPKSSIFWYCIRQQLTWKSVS